MARVEREMVERAGVDVNELLELLVKNASAKLTTYYNYTIRRTNLIGLAGEGIKEIAEVTRIEDPDHLEALLPRINTGAELVKYNGHGSSPVLIAIQDRVYACFTQLFLGTGLALVPARGGD